MKTQYPNLELIEYQFLQQLNKDPEYRKRAFQYKTHNKYFHPHFTAQVFPQIWGSTCTGFDITDNGSATISGSAMTEAYTTVLHEQYTDIYGIFFGGMPCYIVAEANQSFYEDLNSRQMAPKSEAETRYNNRTKNRESTECERY